MGRILFTALSSVAYKQTQKNNSIDNPVQVSVLRQNKWHFGRKLYINLTDLLMKIITYNNTGKYLDIN